MLCFLCEICLRLIIIIKDAIIIKARLPPTYEYSTENFHFPTLYVRLLEELDFFAEDTTSTHFLFSVLIISKTWNCGVDARNEGIVAKTELEGNTKKKSYSVTLGDFRQFSCVLYTKNNLKFEQEGHVFLYKLYITLQKRFWKEVGYIFLMYNFFLASVVLTVMVDFLPESCMHGCRLAGMRVWEWERRSLLKSLFFDLTVIKWFLGWKARLLGDLAIYFLVKMMMMVRVKLGGKGKKKRVGLNSYFIFSLDDTTHIIILTFRIASSSHEWNQRKNGGNCWKERNHHISLTFSNDIVGQLRKNAIFLGYSQKNIFCSWIIKKQV